MLVAVPEPFDFDLTVERFRAFGDDPVNRFRDGALHRFLGGRELRLEPAPGGVVIAPPDQGLTGSVRRLVGGGFDVAGFASASRGDPDLGPLVRRLRGFRPAQVPDAFEMLVTSITAQQVSLRAALAIRSRFVERFGRAGKVAWEFPRREAVAGARPDELRALGFSTRKAEYVVALARAGVDLEALAALPDEEVVERLTALPGIGRWTAEWYLARHLGRPDVWPAGDLGVRKAVSAFLLGGRQAGEAEVRELGARFAPHRTLAAHVLLVALRVP